MKIWILAAALLVASSFSFAQSAQTAQPAQTASAAQTASTEPAAPAVRKPCEDLKAEIAKKLDAKGVVGYTLDAVDKGKEGDGKIIGSCDGGTKSIVYTRGGATQAKATEEKKPQ